jgi:ABC-type transport system substrate-binding protein
MRRSYILFAVSLLAVLMLAACGAPAAAPAPEAAVPAASGPVVNRLGNTLPEGALPLEQQVFRYPSNEQKYMTWDASVYEENDGDNYGWPDSCVRPDKDFNPQPNVCESWSVSDDGLVWTFNLQQDKVWSDGTPLTANDFVFTFQRYARPDYDFEWFYSMMGIKNWAQVVSGELPPEELGVKAVDDHTLTIETDYPVPYLIKIMADVWVVAHSTSSRIASTTARGRSILKTMSPPGRSSWRAMKKANA